VDKCPLQTGLSAKAKSSPFNRIASLPFWCETCTVTPMTLAMTLNRWKFKGWRSKGWRSSGARLCTVALISLVAGSLITARLAQVNQVKANSNPVFELRIYHAVPGKLPALESRFRDTTSKLLAKHGLKVVGYWVAEGSPGWDNTFIFLLAHSSRDEAKKNWDAMRADPEFQEMIKSEQADKLVEKIDSIYMRPTDFSPNLEALIRHNARSTPAEL
jgi:NIPSNAP